MKKGKTVRLIGDDIVGFSLGRIGLPSMVVHADPKPGEKIMMCNPLRKDAGVVMVENLGNQRIEISRGVPVARDPSPFWTAFRKGDWSWRTFAIMVLLAGALGISALFFFVLYIGHAILRAW